MDEMALVTFSSLVVVDKNSASGRARLKLASSRRISLDSKREVYCKCMILDSLLSGSSVRLTLRSRLTS